MGLVYTVSGFPTNNQAPQTQDAPVLYHDANIDALYASSATNQEISFPAELETLETVLRAWSAAGGLFDNLLQPGVLVSASVTSFVLETAAIVNGDKTRRGLSFQDWALLLKPCEDTTVGPPQLNDAAKQTLQMCAGLSLEALIQQWILTAGFEDLIGTMKIYVGDIQA
jgi:hypothetical protein